MAQKTVVTLIDDLTGEAAEDITTVPFAIDGVNYEIDLTEDNEARLRNELDAYISAARRVSGSTSRRSATSAKASVTSARSSAPAGNRSEEIELRKTIREWAQREGEKYGLSFGSRGRLGDDVVEAYEKQDIKLTNKYRQTVAQVPTVESAAASSTTMPSPWDAPASAAGSGDPLFSGA